MTIKLQGIVLLVAMCLAMVSVESKLKTVEIILAFVLQSKFSNQPVLFRKLGIGQTWDIAFSSNIQLPSSSLI